MWSLITGCSPPEAAALFLKCHSVILDQGSSPPEAAALFWEGLGMWPLVNNCAEVWCRVRRCTKEGAYISASCLVSEGPAFSETQRGLVVI